MEEKKSNYARAGEIASLWKEVTERRARFSSLYDSEIINYCFVCRHIAFVTVKERRLDSYLTWSLPKAASAHTIYCNLYCNYVAHLPQRF